MLVPIVQTGVLAVLWYLWWKWPGKSMMRSTFTGITVRERTASGVNIISWNAAFVILLSWIWWMPWWLAVPLLAFIAIAAWVVNSWAKKPE